MALDRSLLSVVGFWLLADFVCCWLQVAVEAGNINFSVPRLAPKIVCLTQGARTYTHPTHTAILCISVSGSHCPHLMFNKYGASPFFVRLCCGHTDKHIYFINSKWQRERVQMPLYALIALQPVERANNERNTCITPPPCMPNWSV